MTPIIRKIDEMGRIIIPRDMRRELKLYPNDSIKIELTDNKIIISKNSININTISKIVNTLYKTITCNIIITNMDSIILYKGNINITSYSLSNELISKINHKKEEIENKKLYITDDFIIENYILNPLIINGNSIGSIICFSEKNIDENTKKAIKITTQYIENILEE